MINFNKFPGENTQEHNLHLPQILIINPEYQQLEVSENKKKMDWSIQLTTNQTSIKSFCM